MSQTIPNRGELNIEAIDAQIRAWVKAGQPWEEIINLAKDTWPALPKDYVYASIKLIGRILRMEKPVPIQPFRDLSIIHRQRRRRIKEIEARLAANDASVSLEALYRGLLRDQEAACHKIMAVQRQMEEDRKQLVKDEVAAEREAKIFQQVFEQRMQQQSPAAERHSHEPSDSVTKPSLMKTVSLMIGFFLAWLFTGNGQGCCQFMAGIPQQTRAVCESRIINSCPGASHTLDVIPSILSKLGVPRTVPVSLPARRKPVDPENAC